MSLELSKNTKKKIDEIMSRYPKKEAALLPVLHVVQNELGYISASTEKLVASLCSISPVRVREIVTFYSMYNRQPVGKYHIQVCTNLSCSLLGGTSLLEYLQEKIGIKPAETSSDKKFTLSTVECLGACEEAPCMMVNFDYHGNLTKEKIDEILESLK